MTLRVAIIEDSADLLDELLAFLRHRGFDAWGVGSAEAFWRQLHRRARRWQVSNDNSEQGELTGPVGRTVAETAWPQPFAMAANARPIPRLAV